MKISVCYGGHGENNSCAFPGVAASIVSFLTRARLCLCPCVSSRQDILNYFAQLPPWTLATARQCTHHADTHTHSYWDHSSCPSHAWILLDTDQTRKKVMQFAENLLSGCFKWKCQIMDFFFFQWLSEKKEDVRLNWVVVVFQEEIFSSTLLRKGDMNVRFYLILWKNKHRINVKYFVRLSCMCSHTRGKIVYFHRNEVGDSTCDWLFLLVPTDSYVMCDHFNSVLLFLPWNTDLGNQLHHFFFPQKHVSKQTMAVFIPLISG